MIIRRIVSSVLMTPLPVFPSNQCPQNEYNSDTTKLCQRSWPLILTSIQGEQGIMSLFPFLILFDCLLLITWWYPCSWCPCLFLMIVSFSLSSSCFHQLYHGWECVAKRKRERDNENLECKPNICSSGFDDFSCLCFIRWSLGIKIKQMHFL